MKRRSRIDHAFFGRPRGRTSIPTRAVEKHARTTDTTDEIGLWAVADKVHVHALHATILHYLALEDERLTYLHNGRDERPTINGGRVIQAVLA